MTDLIAELGAIDAFRDFDRDDRRRVAALCEARQAPVGLAARRAD